MSGQAQRAALLTLTLSDITGCGAVCTVTNDSAEDVAFGRDATLSVWEDGAWRPLPRTDAPMTMELLHAPSGGSMTFPVCWEWQYGRLPAGRYRIEKPVSCGDTVIRLTAEFDRKA